MTIIICHKRYMNKQTKYIFLDNIDLLSLLHPVCCFLSNNTRLYTIITLFAIFSTKKTVSLFDTLLCLFDHNPQ
jgi:hypothetical protein